MLYFYAEVVKIGTGSKQGYQLFYSAYYQTEHVILVKPLGERGPLHRPPFTPEEERQPLPTAYSRHRWTD